MQRLIGRCPRSASLPSEPLSNTGGNAASQQVDTQIAKRCAYGGSHIRLSRMTVVNPGPLLRLVHPQSQTPARELFGARQHLHGWKRTRSGCLYAKGCLAEALALPINGKTWQVMRPPSTEIGAIQRGRTSPNEPREKVSYRQRRPTLEVARIDLGDSLLSDWLMSHRGQTRPSWPRRYFR